MPKKISQHYITVNKKKYSYTLQKHNAQTTYVRCDNACINQPFLNEDVPALLADLPSLIAAEHEYKSAQSAVVRFRVHPEEKKRIHQRAVEKGYKTISSFLRDIALAAR